MSRFTAEPEVEVSSKSPLVTSVGCFWYFTTIPAIESEPETINLMFPDVSIEVNSGKKATMLCTASVEEVIDQHYKDQIEYISTNEKKEKDLLSKVKKFREDELEHRDIAYEEGADKEGIYGILDAIIKTGSRTAIKISEKI